MKVITISILITRSSYRPKADITTSELGQSARASAPTASGTARVAVQWFAMHRPRRCPRRAGIPAHGSVQLVLVRAVQQRQGLVVLWDENARFAQFHILPEPRIAVVGSRSGSGTTAAQLGAAEPSGREVPLDTHP
jgi:hypothetical protein